MIINENSLAGVFRSCLDLLPLCVLFHQGF